MHIVQVYAKLEGTSGEGTIYASGDSQGAAQFWLLCFVTNRDRGKLDIKGFKCKMLAVSPAPLAHSLLRRRIRNPAAGVRVLVKQREM